MGLPVSFEEISSESIPILFVARAAHFLSCFRHSLYNLLRILRLVLLGPWFCEREGKGQGHGHGQEEEEEEDVDRVGSGLASLIALAEQLTSSTSKDSLYCGGECEEQKLDCAVCLFDMREGEEVRRLGCGHWFHRKCLDNWLFQEDAWFLRQEGSCPLCRAPIVPKEHTRAKEKQISRELAMFLNGVMRG
ncbi:hypothetical protein AMTRI_Chr12g268970 [Amborella trichopoda]